jgi:pimeloyl-ACP methyl ester carboxylesterase
VLVISGEHDALVSAEDAHALRDALVHADAVVAPGPLHPPGVVRPEGLAEVIATWARDPLPR